jgi:hypothetical protein
MLACNDERNTSILGQNMSLVDETREKRNMLNSQLQNTQLNLRVKVSCVLYTGKLLPVPNCMVVK